MLRICLGEWFRGKDCVYFGGAGVDEIQSDCGGTGGVFGQIVVEPVSYRR